MPTIHLSWSEAASNCSFDVYSSTLPYIGYTLLISDVSGLSYEDPVGTAGDPANNTFYYVTAEACVGGDTAISNAVGEFDFDLIQGD